MHDCDFKPIAVHFDYTMPLNHKQWIKINIGTLYTCQVLLPHTGTTEKGVDHSINKREMNVSRMRGCYKWGDS